LSAYQSLQNFFRSLGEISYADFTARTYIQYITFIWFINQVLSQFATHCVAIWNGQYIVFETYT
ncbi:hypothetical protein, partial [Blautia wexlerae]|uniref:hypothetical protein n=1 Tax=Blautia wexlerae TaxID=418240 RepID=UPI001A9B6D0F